MLATFISSSLCFIALRLSFSESDTTVTESDRLATVTVTKTGRNVGDVLCTLIPISVEDALDQYGYDLDTDDPAETGINKLNNYSMKG